MRPHIALYQRPSIGTARLPYEIDRVARGYSRITSAVGGFYTATFDIYAADVGTQTLQHYFDTLIGSAFKEHAYGITTWEGIVYAMNLVVNGAEHFITLESDWWHNSTDVFYSNAAVADTNQGNLTYTSETSNVDSNQGALAYIQATQDTNQANMTYGTSSFQDDGQDFEDWETDSGNAAYIIVVTNGDASTTWAYLGSEFTTTNPNDSINVFQDTANTTTGWNGAGISGKTPASYIIISVAGKFQDDGQNFDDYEYDGSVIYEIVITNSDASTTSGYIRDDFTTLNPSDSCNVYRNLNFSQAGWNGTEPIGKTPSTYIVRSYYITFTDDAQDFTDWETTTGDATYRIQVANDDNTTSWAYIGAKVSNTEIYVYSDEGLTTLGWNDADATDKTPESYQIIQVSLEGSRSNIGASSNTDSQNEYGTMEEILSLAGASSASATALRDRHQDEFAWPRARFVNQGDPGNDVLTVTLAGFWYTLFWKFRRISETAACSTLVSSIVADSEFVTAGRIDTNSLEVSADAYPMPQRLGDLIESVVSHGDALGNQYRCGVYAGRKLHYEQVPTTPEYFVSGGELLDRAHAPVINALVSPGVYARHKTVPRITPPGASSSAQTGTTYIDQVEYDRDSDTLRLTLAGEPFSVLTLQEQIQSGVASQAFSAVSMFGERSGGRQR